VAKIHERIDGRLRQFIERQHVFFVATAPRDGGHVNVSPKGVDGTFAVIDELTVGYLDITASGAETIAHLRENGRITVMFCAFDGPPNVVRLHGCGRVVTVYDEALATYRRTKNQVSIDGLPAFDFNPPAGSREKARRRPECGIDVPHAGMPRTVA